MSEETNSEHAHDEHHDHSFPGWVTFGETKKFFRISNSVFMGGTIAKKGGQNPLEAARYGSKIFHGPDIKNFPDIFRLLKNHN